MFDIMSTFIAAVLVTFNLDVFEVPAHEIEFSNELTLAPVWKSTRVSGVRGDGVEVDERALNLISTQAGIS